MAKCPDCKGTAFMSCPPAGDGVCSSCGGDGKKILSGLNEAIFNTSLECDSCDGTGKCQTCGGSGEV